MKLIELKSLEEGVHDPHIFKAVFMAGAGGSGKSRIAKMLFQGTGLKMVNIDPIFELLMKKHNLSLKMDTASGEETEREEIRTKSSGIFKNQLNTYIDGRLGLIIDGTGRDLNKVKRLQSVLEEFGYETGMVFVNTSLETALERNQKRDRTVSEKIVKSTYKNVQDNLGNFQRMFKDRFFIIDNNNYEEAAKMVASVQKRMMNWLESPPKNPIARQWIQSKLKNR